MVAAEPMDFDTDLSYPCKDKTPKEFKDPGLKVAEVMFRISANLDVKEENIENIVYDLEFPEEIGIADFLPKTELGSELAGPIDVRDTRTGKSSIQVGLEEKASVKYLVASGSVSGNINARSEEGTASGVQLRLLPPKQVVSAAGTRSRGKVLCFKLKPLNQITLEGQREFACLLTVPVAWKGTCVLFRGTGRIKGVSSEIVREMKVGLYPDGDSEAKKNVEKEAKAFSPRKREVSKPTPLVVSPRATMKDCVGKWRWRSGNRNINFDLNRDGTFTAKDFPDEASWTEGGGLVSDGKGNWEVEDGRLSITMTHVWTLAFWKEHKVTWIAGEEIVKVSEDQITLKSSKHLRRR